MVRPVDLQGYIVRGVETVQNVSNLLNQQALVQQLVSHEILQRIQREQRSVTRKEGLENPTVRSSLEGGRGSFEARTARSGAPTKREISLKEENKGLLMDVRL